MKKFVQLNENFFQLKEVEKDTPLNDPAGPSMGKTLPMTIGLSQENEMKISRLKSEIRLKVQEIRIKQAEIVNLGKEISELKNELDFLGHKI